MPTVNLSFPDSSYSSTSKPSIVTLKADLTLLETAINAIDNDNIAVGAGITYNKLNLTGGIVNADVAVGAAITYAKLNLTGGIVNADVNASAAIAISKTELLNYNAPATWAPTFDATASLTWNTSASTTLARWSRLGKKVKFHISRYATTGGTGTGLLRITFPVTAASSATGAYGGSCYIAINGTRYPGVWYSVSDTQFHVSRHDGTEFSAGGVVEVIIEAEIEVA